MGDAAFPNFLWIVAAMSCFLLVVVLGLLLFLWMVSWVKPFSSKLFLLDVCLLCGLLLVVVVVKMVFFIPLWL